MQAPLLHGGGSIESISVVPAGLIVEARGVSRQRVTLHDATTGELKRELLSAKTMGHFGHTVVAARSSLYTTYRTGFVDEIDIATGERLRSIELPRLQGDKESWPGSGGALYVTRDAATVYVMVLGHTYAWTNDALVQLDGYAFASPTRFAASHDETVVWTACNELARFQREPGAEATRLSDPIGTDVAYLASCDLLAVARYHGRLELWTPANPPALSESIRVGPDALYAPRVAALRGGAFAAISCADQAIAIAGPGDLAPRARVHGPWAEITALTAIGDVLWVGDRDGRVWSVDTSNEDLSVAPKKKRDFPMTVHENISDIRGVFVDDRLVTVGGYKMSPPLTRDLAVWEHGRRDAIAYRSTKKKLGYEAMIAANGYAIVDDGASFMVVDARTLKTKATLAHKKVEGIAVSPDQRQVVTTSASEMKVWSTDTWQVLQQREGEVPRKAVAWLEHDNLVVFQGANGSFGTFSGVDLKRRATKGLGPLEAFVTDPRVPVVACVVDLGKPGKPDPGLRLWNAVTDTVMALPALHQPAFAGGGLVAIDRDATSLSIFALDGGERARIPLSPGVGPGHRATLYARDNVAVVQWRMEPNVAHPWWPPPTTLLVHLASQEVKPLPAPAAGDVSAVVGITDKLVAIATSAGRVEWLSV